MGARTGFLNLGSLKIDGDHGRLLNSAKQSLLQMPSQNRRGAVLKRIEIGELVEGLGLSDALMGLFMAYKHLIDADEEGGQEALRAGLVDLVSRQLAANRGPVPLASRAVQEDFSPNPETSPHRTIPPAPAVTPPAPVGAVAQPELPEFNESLSPSSGLLEPKEEPEDGRGQDPIQEKPKSFALKGFMKMAQ